MKKSKTKSRHEKTANGIEALMKEFLGKVAESAYLVARKTGFRGSFMMFLNDLQEALEQVIAKDREMSRRGLVSARHGVRHAAVIH